MMGRLAQYPPVPLQAVYACNSRDSVR
jgi:hypothetical protein